MPEAQGSTATVEKPLPVQVQRRADAARRIVEGLKGTQPPAAPPAPAAAPAAAVADEPEEDVGGPMILSKDDPRYKDPNYWMKRGHTVNGMLAAQRGQHEAETAGLQQRIGELTQTVVELKRQLADATAKPVSPTDFLSQEQIDLLGPEQASMIVAATQTQIKNALAQHVESVLGPIREEADKERKAKIASENAKFFAAIKKAVPQFEQLNTDPAFLVYFQEVDPSDPTGRTRYEISRAAEKKLDPNPCIKILRDYLKTLNTPPTTEPVVEPASVPGAGQTPTGDVPVAAAGVLTRAEIQKTYTEMSKRKASDPEVAAFTAKVQQAQKEGRIR